MILCKSVGTLIASLFCVAGALGQPGGPGGGPGGGGRGPMGAPDRELVDQFDADSNSRLDNDEREAARAWVGEQDAGQQGRRRGPRGNNGGRQVGPLPHLDPDALTLDPDEVPHYPDADLYDLGVVRTLFFEFEHAQWYDQLVAFHNSDVEVPARMMVDGRVVGEVGIRFRGNSSFRAAKKSLNVSIDAFENGLRLDGFKTLNLLNANGDDSVMREVLFSQISNQYMPAPRANFVRVVINGVYWGVFENVEQINKDYIEHHYDTRAGVRWKVPVDFSGQGGLVYLGQDLEDYQETYELKTGSATDADWNDLIALCRILEATPDDQLAQTLPEVLDVEEALWFLALDNVLMDEDGYYSRGSDYGLYKDPSGRFHLLTYDNNEAFMVGRGGPGGPSGRGGPGGRGGRGAGRPGPGGPGGGADGPPDGPPQARGGAGGVESMRDPLEYADDNQRPLIRALLAVPQWRAQYLEHVSQINREWMDWQAVGPIVTGYGKMLEEAIDQDPLGPGLEGFNRALDGGEGLNSLRGFIQARHDYLLNHDAMKD